MGRIYTLCIQFAPRWQGEAGLKLSHDLPFPVLRDPPPQLLSRHFADRMAPIRGHVEQRAQHEWPFFNPWMGQNKRPCAWPGKARTASPPMLNAALVVENVHIEGAWPPWGAAATARCPLDSLQTPEQCVGRKPRIDRGDGIHVRRLARATHRRSFVIRGDRSHGDARAAQFAQRPGDGFGRTPPRPETI